MLRYRGAPIAAVLLVSVLIFASCSDDNGATDGAVPDTGSKDVGVKDGVAKDTAGDTASDATTDVIAPDGSAPLKCFELSLDPNIPLAIDGVFDATSQMWRRPHDDTAVCPATALTPAGKAKVPFVAYAFCNKDKVAHTFDFEMLAQTGPKGEAPLDDPYLFLYTGQGIPSDPLQCLAVNDDIPDALNVKDAEIAGITIPAGGAVTMVGTTFTFHPTDGTGNGYYVLVVTVNDP